MTSCKYWKGSDYGPSEGELFDTGQIRSADGVLGGYFPNPNDTGGGGQVPIHNDDTQDPVHYGPMGSPSGPTPPGGSLPPPDGGDSIQPIKRPRRIQPEINTGQISPAATPLSSSVNIERRFSPRSALPNTLLPGSTNTLSTPVAKSASTKSTSWTKVPQSWNDLPQKAPADIRDLIANASFGGINGQYVRSTNFATVTGGPPPVPPPPFGPGPGPSAWSTTPLSLSGSPQVFTLGTDNQLLVELAKQWNFSHLGANLSAGLSPLLANVIYLRAGEGWRMSIPLTSSATLTDVQLSFRNNAASVGDFTGGSTGSIPAISFTGSFSGPLPLVISLRKAGHAHLALRAIDSLGNFSMFGLECIIID